MPLMLAILVALLLAVVVLKYVLFAMIYVFGGASRKVRFAGASKGFFLFVEGLIGLGIVLMLAGYLIGLGFNSTR